MICAGMHVCSNFRVLVGPLLCSVASVARLIVWLTCCSVLACFIPCLSFLLSCVLASLPVLGGYGGCRGSCGMWAIFLGPVLPLAYVLFSAGQQGYEG